MISHACGKSPLVKTAGRGTRSSDPDARVFLSFNDALSEKNRHLSQSFRQRAKY